MRPPTAWLHRLLRVLLGAGMLLLWPTALKAAQTVFYQPLNGDRSLNAEQWRGLWQQTRAQGYGRVIVQWSAFGDERFDQNNWLLESLMEAHRQGLSLVIGLAADPAYFQTVLQPGWKDSFAGYWATLQRQSLAQHQRLQPLLVQKQLPVEGWYIPAELSDRLFAERKRRVETRDQLLLLAQRLNRPLHVSAYSNGQLSPEANALWLSSLEQAGLQVWWQDGEGLHDLPAPARQAYLQALPCAIGVVREAFRQVSAPGAPFAAVPAPPQPPVPCHPDAVFELRYLPWAGQLLTPR
jgi:hypothetical protein